ncbi:MAG: trypsin-like peptidase domain-containing protein [Gammaproteobacteria bacterium]|nr:trypsin-like peptidase domain-containing protein [Gammaproteobacteria bacterium]
MKRIAFWLCVLVAVMLYASLGWAELLNPVAHEKMVYPVVRVTTHQGGGSGTVIYSKPNTAGHYSTYVLTNHHVIQAAVRIDEVWDTKKQKKVKKEKRSIVYVEVFQYRNISNPIGTLKLEADITCYDEMGDMALLKLRSETPVAHVATLRAREAVDTIHVLDETVAVGCSLLWPPLPTTGILTRQGFQVDSLPYHMSSAQIIYGNSGGAMFLAETGELIGIPSMVAVIGWGSPVTHMGLFIPVSRIYEWLDEDGYSFLWDPAITEDDALKAIEEKDEKAKEADED